MKIFDLLFRSHYLRLFVRIIWSTCFFFFFVGDQQQKKFSVCLVHVIALLPSLFFYWRFCVPFGSFLFLISFFFIMLRHLTNLHSRHLLVPNVGVTSTVRTICSTPGTFQKHLNFSNRHIGPREDDKKYMLNKIGFNVCFQWRGRIRGGSLPFYLGFCVKRIPVSKENFGFNFRIKMISSIRFWLKVLKLYKIKFSFDFDRFLGEVFLY